MSRPKILIVEDDELIRNLISMAIKKFYPHRFSILEAKDIVTAKQLLETEGIILVILDLYLPDGLGMDLLRTSLRLNEKIPTLVLTADESSSALEQAIDLGADDFLTKPIDILVLESKVKTLLQGSYYSPFAFLGNAEENLKITLQHKTVIHQLFEDRVVFSVPMSIQKNTRVELKLDDDKLVFPAFVTKSIEHAESGCYLVEARIDEDLPLAVSGRIRKLIANLTQAA